MGQKRNPFRILVDKNLQVRFAIFVGGVIVASLALIWISLEILLMIFMRNFAADQTIIDVLKDIHFYILYFFFWEGLLVLGAGIFLTFLLSRRIVGPIYHIQEVLSAFFTHRGDSIPELRVRAKDEFQDLTQLVSKCIEELKQRDTK